MNHAHDVHRLAAESPADENTARAESLTRWMNVDTAAEWVGVPVEEVLDAISDRTLPAVNSHPLRPGRWMVRLADLESWARPRR